MVQLDLEGADGERGEDLRGDRDHLGVGHHGQVGARHVEVALVELAVPPARQLGVVPPVDLGDVEALDVAHRVHGQEAGEGHGQVVAQRQELPALVRQVVDQLAVLPVLARQRLLELEHGRVDLHRPVAVKDAPDGGEGPRPHLHLLGPEVARALGDLGRAPHPTRPQALQKRLHLRARWPPTWANARTCICRSERRG